MQLVTFDKKTVLLHTKISAQVKARIAKLADTSGVPENVIINTLLTTGIEGKFMAKPAKKKVKKTTTKKGY